MTIRKNDRQHAALLVNMAGSRHDWGLCHVLSRFVVDLDDCLPREIAVWQSSKSSTNISERSYDQLRQINEVRELRDNAYALLKDMAQKKTYDDEWRPEAEEPGAGLSAAERIRRRMEAFPED